MEGMALFLSHELPAAVFYSREKGWNAGPPGASRLIYGIWRMTMEKLMAILNDIDDSIQWEKEQGLIDRRLLDSLE